MDLIGLLGHVPPLLDACIDDNITLLRTVRLVSKEASRITLLPLRSYTLTLEGLEGYRTVSGASLLRGAHLQTLNVVLHLSRTFSPAVMLEAFVRGAKPALSTLTNLTLQLEDISNSMFLEEVLSTAMTMLVSACPVLTSFTFKGHLSTSFICSLGESCPLLSHMIYLSPDADDQAYLQHLLQLQPSFLPHITDLVLEGCGDNYQLSDMSLNTSITTLELHAWTFESSADWLLLPPNLHHLKCLYINQGPPPSPANKGLLECLATLELMEKPPTLPLRVFVQLLQAAPALQILNLSPDPSGCSCIIEVSLFLLTSVPIAADLAYLKSRFNLPIVRNAAYNISFTDRDADDESLCAVMGLLPIMTGVAKIAIFCPGAFELGHLLNVFPDATDVGLEYCYDLTDVQLQVVARSKKLKCLRLERCHSVTPLGLFAICQRLPCLANVVCQQCDLLSGAALHGCVQLLHDHGSLVQILEI